MPWCVDIIESERGWGMRVDETLVFGEDREVAETYVREYNGKYNTATVVPDWYMAAQAPYHVRVEPKGHNVVKMPVDKPQK